MGLSRKRKRELKRLKNQAESLWDDQREVLEHANRVVRHARKQAAAFAREEVSPRLRDGVAATRSAATSVAGSAKDKLVDDVFPAVSSALGSALAALDIAKDPRVRSALGKVPFIGQKLAPPPKSPGPGRYILIGFAVVATAAIAYAAWQTLRADDDLWIDDEPGPLEEASL